LRYLIILIFTFFLCFWQQLNAAVRSPFACCCRCLCWLYIRNRISGGCLLSRALVRYHRTESTQAVQYCGITPSALRTAPHWRTCVFSSARCRRPAASRPAYLYYVPLGLSPFVSPLCPCRTPLRWSLLSSSNC
jgi:hypothetical protein